MGSSLRHNLLIALAVLLIVFTISIVWALRDPIVPKLFAGIDYLGVTFGFKEDSGDLENTGGTSQYSKEVRAGLKKMKAEKERLRNSKKQLRDEIKRLEEEIDTLRLDVQIFKEIVFEIKMEKELIKIKQELVAEMKTERKLGEEEELTDEPEPVEEPEAQEDTYDEDQIFNEAVDSYVNWLGDNRTYAKQNQKAYLCGNQNVAQFLSGGESSAFREACALTGYNTARTRIDITGNQKSFLCRNRSVAQFLARNPNISISEVCGN